MINPAANKPAKTPMFNNIPIQHIIVPALAVGIPTFWMKLVLLIFLQKRGLVWV